MKTDSESAIQFFSLRMAKGPNSDCKRSATHSPNRWLRKLFLAGGALLEFLILACSMLSWHCCLCDAFYAQIMCTKRSVGSSCRPARMIAETVGWITVLEAGIENCTVYLISLRAY